MNVAFEGNFRSSDKGEAPLRKIEVEQSFTWGEKVIRIPAIYIFEKGVVLDLCVQADENKFNAFMKKLKSDGESEELDAENPLAFSANITLALDGKTLITKQSCSMAWHPNTEAEPMALKYEELCEEYGCTGVGVFWRGSFAWNGEKVSSPKQSALDISACKTPVTVGKFTTSDSFEPFEIEVMHPQTKKAHLVAVEGCKDELLDEKIAFNNRFEFPRCYKAISYRVSPPCEDIIIQDIAQSDHPKSADGDCIGGAIGLIYMHDEADNEAVTVSSSAHFEPAKAVDWRIAFNIAPYPDGHIAFNL